MTTPTPEALAAPGPRRPEVVALAAAVAEPLTGFTQDGSEGRVAIIDHGLAQDLMILIADLCGPGHLGCWACGEAFVCGPCGLGDASLWCWCPSGFGGPLCPSCTEDNCHRCATGGH